jgi:internalin A
MESNLIEIKKKIMTASDYRQFLPEDKKTTRKKSVFISYSHDDIEFRKESQKFLVNIERDNLIEIWQDGMIETGADWDEKMKENLKNADICILLVSQDFIASNYVHETEFKKIMEKRVNENCQIIPVLVKESDWQNWKVYPDDISNKLNQEQVKDYSIGRFQFLPVDNKKRLKPVNRWRYQEEAWKQVADAVRKFCAEKK